ncbi:MAG TPA: polyprenyl synthetase family protein, partial [Candidatus Thermoplasmatota archaeon]|nr:polyprenyl synthetase family protein [Candidatus Thermoplasmatota archaeon]
YIPPEGPTELTTSLRSYLAYGSKRVRPSLRVYEPIRHVVEAGGKRIRPTLCLLACEAVGGRAEQALPTACGIEFLHTFTLVHDDIMDKDLTRRDRPTVGALWGDDVAITAGDGLFALAMKAFADNARVPGVSADRVVRVIREAADTSLHLAQGQTMDLMQARRDDVRVEEYLEMIRLKTGVLLEFSLQAGALLGGATEEEVRAFGRVGAPLGMAFQIRDDLLGLIGDPATLGKPVGGDVKTGKRTLMAVHAMRASRDGERLAAILNTPPEKTTEEDVQEALRIMRDAGSLDLAHRTADRYVEEAKAAIRDLPRTAGTEALGALANLADYILHRDR